MTAAALCERRHLQMQYAFRRLQTAAYRRNYAAFLFDFALSSSALFA